MIKNLLWYIHNTHLREKTEEEIKNSKVIKDDLSTRYGEQVSYDLVERVFPQKITNSIIVASMKRFAVLFKRFGGDLELNALLRSLLAQCMNGNLR